MAGTHPYISGAGNVSQMVSHLRKSFPASITSDTVKRLGIAPNNESYVISVLQFIGVIDTDGKKTQDAAQVFSHHKDDDFAIAFSVLVEKAYSALFDLHGDAAWKLTDDELITFFRQTDQTSATIGRRQASVFKILAGLAGHADLPAPRAAKIPKRGGVTKSSPKPAAKATAPTPPPPPKSEKPTEANVGLTVRVEINLPADGTKEVYDNIFRSIKENLLGG